MKAMKNEYYYPENLFRMSFEYLYGSSEFNRYFTGTQDDKINKMNTILNLQILNSNEKYIATNYFSDDTNSLTYESIGKELGIGKARTGQIVRLIYGKIYRATCCYDAYSKMNDNTNVSELCNAGIISKKNYDILVKYYRNNLFTIRDLKNAIKDNSIFRIKGFGIKAISKLKVYLV